MFFNALSCRVAHHPALRCVCVPGVGNASRCGHHKPNPFPFRNPTMPFADGLIERCQEDVKPHIYLSNCVRCQHCWGLNYIYKIFVHHNWYTEPDPKAQVVDGPPFTVDVRGLRLVESAPSLRVVLFAIADASCDAKGTSLTAEQNKITGLFDIVVFKAVFPHVIYYKHVWVAKRLRMKVVPSESKRGALSQLSGISPLEFSLALTDEYEKRWGGEDQ